MKRLGGILAASVLGLTGAGLIALPAHADAYIKICNSNYSFTRIEVKPNGGRLNNGQCTSQLANGSNQVRVDTDPDGPSHSYFIDPVGAVQGPCHTNSDNHNSDPPNYAEVWYRNFDHGNCS